MIVKGSFEDVLFVGLGIVWLIYSALKANKKTKQSVDDGLEGSVEQDLFEQMMEREGLAVPEPADQFEEREEDKQGSSIESSTYFSFDEEVESKEHVETNFRRERQQENLIRENEIGGQNKKNKRFKFNLKDAFIYSEILNAKYVDEL
jgi:hypothetical protein